MVDYNDLGISILNTTKHQENFGPTLEALLLHKEWLRRLARSLVFDASQADDVVQQVFLSALKYRPSADRDIRPWLKVVATAVAKKIGRSEVRRTRREKATAKVDILPLEERIAQLETSDTYRQLGEFLKSLEEPYRTILLMHYFEGLPIDLVGKRLGLSRSTVRNRYKRGIELLRARLDSRYGDRTAWGLLLLPEIPLMAPSGAPPVLRNARGPIAKKGLWGIAAGILLVPAAAMLLSSTIADSGAGARGQEALVTRMQKAPADASAFGARSPILDSNSRLNPENVAAPAGTAMEPNEKAGGEPRPAMRGGGPRAVNFQTGESVPAQLVSGESSESAEKDALSNPGAASPETPGPASPQPAKGPPPKYVRKGGMSVQKSQ